MIKLQDLLKLDLGRPGDEILPVHEIDISTQLEKWADATFEIVVIRPGETEDDAYFATTEVEGNVLRWTVQLGDVSIPGKGYAHCIVTYAGGTWNSQDWRTEIHRNASGINTEVPSAIQPWVDVVAKAGSDAKEAGAEVMGMYDTLIEVRDETVQSASEASSSAEDTKRYMQAAQASATSALNSERKAGDSASQALTAASFVSAAKTDVNKAKEDAVNANTYAQQARSQAIAARTEADRSAETARQQATGASNYAAQASASAAGAASAQAQAENFSVSAATSTNKAYEYMIQASSDAHSASQSKQQTATYLEDAQRAAGRANDRASDAQNYATQAQTSSIMLSSLYPNLVTQVKDVKNEILRDSTVYATSTINVDAGMSIPTTYPLLVEMDIAEGTEYKIRVYNTAYHSYLLVTIFYEDRSNTGTSFDFRDGSITDLEKTFTASKNIIAFGLTTYNPSDVAGEVELYAAYDQHNEGSFEGRVEDELDVIRNTGDTPVAPGKVWTSTADGAAWKDATGGGGGISDVQVNGTSVVTDGVANVPVAKKNAVGVVYATNQHGIVLNENTGLISVAMAQNTAIDARSQQYAPIVPKTLDYAVKVAMCDGKGEAWTAEEQKAAQERLGIDGGKKEFVLINSYTVPADMADDDLPTIVEFTTDSDGKPFKLSEFQFKCSAGVMSGHSGKYKLIMKAGTTGSRLTYPAAPINASLTTSLRNFWCGRTENTYFCVGSLAAGFPNANSSSITQGFLPFTELPSMWVGVAFFDANNAETQCIRGTSIELWGVRA